MESGNIAKAVIISSLVTLLVLAATGYVVREPVLSYIRSEVSVSPSPTKLTPGAVAVDRVVQTVAQANPAVVSIVVSKSVPVYERYYESYEDSLYGGFTIPRVRENGTEEREIGGGSGFIVSNDGLIVTNRHVVEDKEANYTVFLTDGLDYQVEVLALDPQLDIAILKIAEPLEAALTYLQFGDSEALQLGEPVIAIGNALAEFRNSVSVGVVSGLSRSIVASDGRGQSEQLDQVIQTDAAINPGNSGGPLLNINGQVIGVNVATSRGADNIGFALPAHVVAGVVDSVREHGEIIRPFLGVRYAMIDQRIAELNQLAVDYGALVIPGETAAELAVMPGSAASQAGIAAGTIILSIDGEELREQDLATVLRTKSIGQEITLELYQDGDVRTVEVILDRTP
jgi:serine protease Do